MAHSSKKVKVTERAKGKIITLSHLKEGTVESFDGTRIWYRSFGTGEPAIVCCNGLGVGTFFWTYLEKHFRGTHRIVTFDYRGHGHSELKRNPRTYNLSSLVKDCKAVVDGLGLKKSIFVGHSLGVQLILELYRYWPEVFAGMILCFGTYGHPMDNFYNSKLSRHLFDIIYKISTKFPSQSNRISHLLLDNPLSFWMGGFFKIMHTGMMNKEDAERYIKHILAVDPLFFSMLLKSLQDHSAEDVLASVDVPTLIMGGELDQFTPEWISKRMHHLIPKSELLLMSKATHAGLVEQSDLVNLRIEKFIRERVKFRGWKSQQAQAKKIEAAPVKATTKTKAKAKVVKPAKIKMKTKNTSLRLVQGGH